MSNEFEENYHWNDREKAAEDFSYLQRLKSNLIHHLKTELNNLHNTNFSAKAWQVMLGYWLNQFLTVAFDRYSIILKESSKSCKVWINYPPDHEIHWIPSTTADAGHQFVDEEWNNFFMNRLRVELIQEKLINNFTIQKCEFNGNHFLSPQSVAPPFFTKKYIKKCFSLGIKYLRPGKDVIVLCGTSLSLVNLIRLRLKISGVVIYDPVFPSYPEKKIDYTMRSWKLAISKNDNTFEKIIKRIIPYWIPTVYIEGFSIFQKKLSDASKIPKNPRVIFTSISHWDNEAFKIWLAMCLDNGSKLVIGQHGGGPFHRYNGGHQNELEIADFYATTGSGNLGYSNLRDVGQFFAKLDLGKWSPCGDAVMVTVLMPRYVFDLRSMALGSQMLNYFNEQFIFYKNLPEEIQKKTLVRIYRGFGDYGWGVKQRWLSVFPKIKFDLGDLSLKDRIKRCRLVVGTYNATAYCESLAANIPTVIYWNTKYWEMAKFTDNDFKELELVGIFHRSPESAAKHVAAIWNNVAEWWEGRELQLAREKFCRKYAFRHPSVVDKLASVLREAKSSRPIYR